MSDYCEYPEFYNETHPIAHKEHVCCECRGTIRVGEKYAKCVGKFDGAVYSESQHFACRDFAAKLNREYGGGHGCFIPFGDVGSAIRNMRDWPAEPEPNDAINLRAEWAVIRAAGRGESLPQEVPMKK